MVNEIIISVPLIEYPLERFLSILLGIGAFIHFLLMANFANPKSPWCVGITLACVAGTGAGMIASGIAGNIEYIYHFSMGGVASILALWLLLWYKGLHVNEFLDKNCKTEAP